MEDRLIFLVNRPKKDDEPKPTKLYADRMNGTWTLPAEIWAVMGESRREKKEGTPSGKEAKHC